MGEGRRDVAGKIEEVCAAIREHEPAVRRDVIALGNDAQYARFCEIAGRPDLAADPRFVRNADRVRNRGALVPVLAGIMKTRTKADWLSRLEAAKVPCGAINKLDEVWEASRRAGFKLPEI